MDLTSADDAQGRPTGDTPGRRAAAPQQPGHGASRRHVLGLAVAAGAGLPLLTACGGGDEATTTGAGSSGSGAPSSATSSKPAGPLVATGKVPVNGGVILDSQKIVVTQPTDGTFKAFTAVCTHQACIVGSVKDGVISCPCHGSAYSAADGSVQNGPATRALKEIPVTVQDGEVVEA
jgi:nitrite reductase/ring-hydroxylating ferredoxin subunit